MGGKTRNQNERDVGIFGYPLGLEVEQNNCLVINELVAALLQLYSLMQMNSSINKITSNPKTKPRDKIVSMQQ